MASPVKSVPISHTVVGDGSVKIIVPLTGNCEATLVRELAAAQDSVADLVEWRADFLEGATQSSLTSAAMTLRAHATLPVLWTLRTASEGGALKIADDDYEKITQYFASSGFADAIDVEVKRGATGTVAAAHTAGIPVVMSYHNFKATPSARTLAKLFADMDAAGGDILKIAVMPQEPADVLTLMSAAMKAREKHQKPVIAISMGNLGRITRVTGSLFGSDATFASQNAQGSAPGQINAIKMAELLELFSA